MFCGKLHYIDSFIPQLSHGPIWTVCSHVGSDSIALVRRNIVWILIPSFPLNAIATILHCLSFHWLSQSPEFWGSFQLMTFVVRNLTCLLNCPVWTNSNRVGSENILWNVFGTFNKANNYFVIYGFIFRCLF